MSQTSSRHDAPDAVASSGAAAGSLAPVIPSSLPLGPVALSAPSTGAADIAAAATMNQVLSNNFLGVHKMKVNQITGTEFTRQISKSGLRVVRKSIDDHGWDAACTPYCLVPREQLPEGNGTVWTSEVVSKLAVLCLDGNHRVRALLDKFGGDHPVDCRLYLHFDDEVMVNSLARSLNMVTASVALTTTYDRIFSAKVAIAAIMRANNFDDVTKVTATMLGDAYRKGGSGPIGLSQPNLCQNKRLVVGLQGPAFAALKEVSESDDQGIHLPTLSKALLDTEAVLKFPLGKEVEQGYLIHILARFKFNDPGKKTPAKSDIPALRKRALAAGDFLRLLLNAYPFECWSPDFHSAFFRLVYGKAAEWKMHGEGHLLSLTDEAEFLDSKLWKGHVLSTPQKNTIMCQLPAKLEKHAKKSADMKPFYEKWHKERSAVNVFVTTHERAASDQSLSASSSSSDESDKDDEEDENMTSPDDGANTIQCAVCEVSHLKSCSNLSDEEEDGSKCLQCPSGRAPDGGQPARKKHKKAAKTTLPQDNNAVVDTSMSRNTLVYEEALFSGRTKDYKGESPMKTSVPPKLVIVDLTSEPTLFNRTEASKRRLVLFLEATLSGMDKMGTIAFAVPRPWHDAGARVGDACAEIDSADVEAAPLLITYKSVTGGAQKTKALHHLRNQAEQVLLIHHTRPAGDGFCVNPRVVVTDVYGHSLGVIPHPRQHLSLESLPAGAPNGGPRSFFPPKASQFLIARYTNAGDTVLGIGVETTTVALDAIERGRRVEFYLLDASKRGALLTNISGAFHAAHKNGMFKSRAGGADVLVGPSCLPTGLRDITQSARVSDALKTELKNQADVLAASFTVAQKLAKEDSYILQNHFGSNNDGAVISHPGAAVKTEEPVKVTLSHKVDDKSAGV